MPEPTAARPPFDVEVFGVDEPTRLHQLIRMHSPDDDAIGDCWRTCIACILGLDHPALVPHFVAENLDVSRAHDFTAARRWLRLNEGIDLGLIAFDAAATIGIPAIATVASKTGPWNHSVVVRHGTVVWCPSTGAGDHPGDYAIADLVDDVVEVLCRPYDPDPDTQLAEWLATQEVGRG